MFTGIIKHIGELVGKNSTDFGCRIQIRCDGLLDYHIGGSIAVNGVCLTLVSVESDLLNFDVINESLCLTNLGEIETGGFLNLEPSLRLNDFMDGHMVSGHIDFVSKLVRISNGNEYFFDFPLEFNRFLALKGSVCLNGVSLTLNFIDEKCFMVSLIPESLNSSNLKYLVLGDGVNVEVDLIARYIDKLIKK